MSWNTNCTYWVLTIFFKETLYVHGHKNIQQHGRLTPDGAIHVCGGDTYFATIIWSWCWTSVRTLAVTLLASWSLLLWIFSIICWSWPITGSRTSCSLCFLLLRWASNCWMSERGNTADQHTIHHVTSKQKSCIAKTMMSRFKASGIVKLEYVVFPLRLSQKPLHTSKLSTKWD